MLSFTLPREISCVSSNRYRVSSSRTRSDSFCSARISVPKNSFTNSGESIFSREIFSFAIRSPSLNAAASCTALAGPMPRIFLSSLADVRVRPLSVLYFSKISPPTSTAFLPRTPVRNKIAISSRFVRASAPRSNSFSLGPSLRRGRLLPQHSPDARARRLERPRRGLCGYLRRQQQVSRVAAVASRLRPFDATRVVVHLSQGRLTDRVVGQHLPVRSRV